MYRFIFSALVFGVSLSINAATLNSSSIEGSHWEVSKVNINTDSERTLSYQYNDNRLVGRVINFNKKSITSNLPEEIDCQQPAYSVSNKTIDNLIHDAMGDADSANAKNYDLGLDGKKTISVFNTSCHSGSFGGGNTDKNSWIGLPDNNTMLVNWYDGSILTLIPLNSDATPAPSYSCSKAQTPSEKTICSDYELSAYDKSINNSWESAQKDAISVGDNELQKKIVSSQKEWLKKRSACGNDKECLTKSMVERLNILSSMTNGQ